MIFPPIHITIMQPAGYVHSLGFIDQARYFRYQLRRLGAEVSLAKNQLRADAINIVFGAHLGFPADWQKRHVCLIVNLEQLGAGGAAVSQEYLDLLRNAAVVDYAEANTHAYSNSPDSIPLVSFLHAPYLDAGATIELESRPIDLLFYGCINPRRKAFIDRISACGIQVSVVDVGIFGPERDQFIRQAKAVLNCHLMDTCRFEQARAFHAMSLGTPVISERMEVTQAPAAFEDSVFWLREGELESFFKNSFGRPGYFDVARRQLNAFKAADPILQYRNMLEIALEYYRSRSSVESHDPWRPVLLNLGSGKDYKPGWLNINAIESAEPDVIFDLAQPASFPLDMPLRLGGRVILEEACLDQAFANNILAQVADLSVLMGNILRLLKEGGHLIMEVPYERSFTAWHDPANRRAFNENSWTYFMQGFWYLGWFSHRFEMVQLTWLDVKMGSVAKEEAAFMRVILRKVETSPKERAIARTMRADFGEIDDDLPVEKMRV